MLREEAYSILKKHVKSEHLIKHCVAVEIALRFYAQKFGEDVEYWGIVGLLHDIDFEKYPQEHPARAPEVLKEEGFDEEFGINVLSHGRKWDKDRTLLQKTLLACDEMTGFIIACALVRPDKSLDNLEVKSVVKKMKDKGFAKAVNRDLLKEGAESLGLDVKEHIEFVKKALADNVNVAPYAELKFLG